MYQLIDGKREGTVLRIERSSIHDGDGFRTVVFLKGCPLCCKWCSTPESQSFKIQETKTNTYGMIMSVEEVMKEIRKDSLFFFISQGGVTLSGGEILAQLDFSKAILENCRNELLNTAIETSFYAPWENIETILPFVDTAFVDMKQWDAKKHMHYTGVDNALIKENLLKTNESEELFQIIIRIPLVPGVNDDEEELASIGQFAKQLKRLSHIQLLPYHKLGTATYDKLEIPYLLRDVEIPTPEHMERSREIIRRQGVDVI